MLTVVQNENVFSTLIEKLNLVANGLNFTTDGLKKKVRTSQLLKEKKTQPSFVVFVTNLSLMANKEKLYTAN